MQRLQTLEKDIMSTQTFKCHMFANNYKNTNTLATPKLVQQWL